MNLFYKNLFLLLTLLTFSLADFGNLSMDDLAKGRRNSSLTLLSNNGENVLNMNFSSDFAYGPFSTGLGINIVMPDNKRYLYPGLNILEVRYVQYDDGINKAYYGVLSNETYGYGLLMNSYNSNTSGAYFNQATAGFKGHTKYWSPFNVYGMYAGTKVYAGRFSYDVMQIPGIEKPLVLGASYAADLDGVRITSGDLVNEGANGYSIDLGFNVVENVMDAYVEYAGLSNSSHGLAIGTKAKLNEMFRLQLEYRNLGENFVPGIFNSTYEASPVVIDSKPYAYTSASKQGYYAGIELALLPLGILSVGYTDYANSEATIKAAIAFNEIMGYSGVISYEDKPFDKSLSIIRATLAYPINSYSKALINYEKIGNQEPTYTVSYGLTF